MFQVVVQGTGNGYPVITTQDNLIAVLLQLKNISSILRVDWRDLKTVCVLGHYTLHQSVCSFYIES